MSERATAIGRGVAVQVGARAAALVLSLSTIAVSTRYLGVDGYGLLVTTIVFVGLFEALTDLGISEVIVRRVTQGRGGLAHLAGVNLGFSVVLAPVVALACIAAGLVVHHDDPQLQLAIAVVALGLVFLTIGSCAQPVFQTKVRFGASAAADLLSRALTLAATAAVAATDSGLLAMAAVQVIPHLVKMVLSMVAAGRMERWQLRFDRAESWSLLRESLPLTAVLVVAVLYWRADGIILSLLSDEGEVAAYGIAIAVASNLGVLPQVFAQTSLSTISERRVGDPAGFARTVRTGYRMMLVVLLPVAVLGPPLAGDAIRFLTTDQFAERGTLTLQLFLVAVAIGFLNPLLSMVLFSAQRQRFLLGWALVTLTTNIALNLLLVPRYGAVGVGIALIASELLGVIASTYVMHRAGARPPSLLEVARIVPALAVGLAALWLLQDVHFLVAGAVAGVGYGAVVIATGALPLHVVRSLFARRSEEERP